MPHVEQRKDSFISN